MPSYHPKQSNPSMVFILGGEDEDHCKHIDYSIVIISNDTYSNAKANNKFRLFVNIFIFLKNMLYF